LLVGLKVHPSKTREKSRRQFNETDVCRKKHLSTLKGRKLHSGSGRNQGLLLSEQEVTKLLSIEEVMEAVENAFREKAKNKTNS